MSSSGIITPKTVSEGTAQAQAPAASMARVMTLPPEVVFEKISELTAIEDEEQFYNEAVSFVVLLTGARTGILYGRNKSTGDAEPRLMANAVEQVLTEEVHAEINEAAATALNGMQAGRKTVATEGGKLAVLTAPFRPEADGDSDETTESLALVLLLGPERAPYLEPIFSLLQMTVANLVQHGQRVEMEKIRRAFLQATLLIDLFTKASAASDYKAACSIVVSELQEWIGCDRTAVASGKATRLKVDAISGLGEIQKRTHGSDRLLSLMKETVAIDKALAWPPPPVELVDTRVMTASDQGELLGLFSVGNVLSIPLPPADEEDESTAAISFFWRDKHALDRERYELIDAVRPHIAALFSLLKKAMPSGIFGEIRHFRQTASRFKKVSIVAMPLLFLAAMFIPVPHRVPATARITPVESRQVAAPISGVLEESFVKPGETVEKGALLAKLDGKEIGWRLAEAIAKREVAARRRDQARASKNVPATQLAQHEYEALALEVDLLRYQQNNLEIHAPIGGLVLSGDLKRSRGVPVETGQKLFEIASLDRLTVELAVDDEDIYYVKEGMEILIRLESRAGTVFEAEVEEIYPVSEIKNGDNVFVCLAKLDNSERALRPGMRGRARIKSEWKSLGWVLFHKPWEWLRLKFM